MPYGTVAQFEDLPQDLARVVEECRRATLSTVAADGTVAAVPVCFAVTAGNLITAIDRKPKSTTEPARVRNIRREPRVTLLFDRWDEEWTRLAWVMVKGVASIGGADVAPLIQRYPQYRDDPPGGPLIVVEPRIVSWWSWE